jgi:DNA polymerase-4
MSSERTLTADVSGHAEIRQYLRQAAAIVARRLRQQTLAARGVRIKLKTSDFRILTRQMQLREITSTTDVIEQAALSLLEEVDDPGPFRLIGVAVFDMQTGAAGGQLDLLSTRVPAHERLDTVLDEVHRKFGPDSVRRAADLQSRTVFSEDVNLDYLRDEDAHKKGD